MSKEWRELTLGDVADFINGDRGKNYPSPLDRVQQGIPFINTGHIDPTGWLSDERMDYISLEKYEKLGSGKVKSGDIVYCLRGSTIGKTARNKYNKGAIASSLIIVRAKENVSQNFLYYFLTSPFGQSLAQTNDNGSAQPNLSGRVLSQYPISVPNFKIQKAIAGILGKLDDKIELNRQMNQTLEQMAQALFQSWFVDFDPVIDNALAQGNPIPEALAQKAENRKAILACHAELDSASDGSDNQTLNQVQGDGKLPEDLQKLFPNKFTFNDTLNKWIPEGWEDLNLAEIIKIKHGYAFKGEFFSDEPTNDILLTPGNFKIGGGMKFNKLKYYNGEIPEDYILKKDDLIVTMTDLSKEGDTLGFPALVPHSDKLTFLHNQRLGKIEYLTDKVGNKFIYHCLCDREYRHVIVGSASGTTVKHTSPTKILLHKILFSGGGIEALFEKSATSMFEKIEENQKQTETLTQLREVLLPQLISGKLSVPEAMLEVEKVVE